MTGVLALPELADSTALAGDAAALRARFARDGYVLVRGALPPEPLVAAREAVVRVLRDGGWLDAAGRPAAIPLTPDATQAARDPTYRAAAGVAAFNRVAYLPELRALVEHLLGPAVFTYPAKVLRAVAPAPVKTEPGRYAHQDFAFWGVDDMVTTWVPFSDVGPELGGLALVPGSHHGPPVDLRLATGAEDGWATTTYRLGDVVLFHCLTVHAALANTTDRMRYSGDFRWQRVDEPVPRDLVYEAPGDDRELFADRFAADPWWRPVPAGITVVERAGGTVVRPGRSSFTAPHPAWASWHGPRLADAGG